MSSPGQNKITMQDLRYVLMTDHFHLLVEPEEVGDLSRFQAERGTKICSIHPRDLRPIGHVVGGEI